MPSPSLFKYVSPERVQNLERRLIRFSQASVLNDPFEMRPYFEDIAQDDKAVARVQGNKREHVLRKCYAAMLDANPTSVLQQWQTVDAFLGEAARNPGVIDDLMQESTAQALAESRADMPSVRANHASIIDRSVGVLSLTETPCNLLMWAHYARNHQGFVIEFDADHPSFAEARSRPPGFGHLGQVVYTQNRPHNQFLSGLTMVELFFHKSTEWKNEREWRFVRRLQDADDHTHPGVYLFSLEPSSIKSIIFGCQMSDADRSLVWAALSSTTDYSHITVQQAIMEEETYTLRFEDVAAS